jgi:hypothetical protein
VLVAQPVFLTNSLIEHHEDEVPPFAVPILM